MIASSKIKKAPPPLSFKSSKKADWYRVRKCCAQLSRAEMAKAKYRAKKTYARGFTSATISTFNVRFESSC